MTYSPLVVNKAMGQIKKQLRGSRIDP